MAVWWVSEAVPLAVTSMLPLVLLPLLGARAVAEVGPSYGHHMVFLFLGGFVLALAVERSGLHRRLALTTLSLIGASPRRLVWGFLLATAVLSMWLSNTATTLMMLPIAAGVAQRLADPKAPMRLFLAVAYGASIGGLGTLVGTPPNLVLAGMGPRLVPDSPELTFGGWMLFAVPLVIVFLPLVSLWLGRGLGSGGTALATLADERQAMGPWRPAERRAGALFAATAVAWVTRAGFQAGPIEIPGWRALLPDPSMVSDAVPAVGAAILACLIPAGGRSGAALVRWDDVRHGVPWGILLLFGGGFALADAVTAVGLDGWMAEQLAGLDRLPLALVVLAVAWITSSATELTSNTATATLLLPVMAALARALEVPPYLLMVPAAVSASCAFMLPVATPPNAIVIGSGYVRSVDLAREGLLLNIVGGVLITVVTLTLGRLVLPL
jgi:sodium-dependent dicarboxylate transporter 2/3/5